MEEIRQHCAQFLSDDQATQGEAEAWLRKCKPFMQLADTLRKQGFTLRQVAELAAPDAKGPMSELALALLTKLVREEGCE